MTRSRGRWARAASVLMSLLVSVSLMAACSSAPPTEPSSPKTSPNVSIVSMSVAAEPLGLAIYNFQFGIYKESLFVPL